MAVQLARYRFTTSDYHRMGEAGIFQQDDRVELVDGEILRLSPIGSRHAGRVLRLSSLFNRLAGGAVLVNVRNPLVLDEYSEPQPDLTLLRPRADFYTSRHPEPPDVLLLIEVCDTSLPYDREVKLPLYARSGIADMWLLDVEREHVLVYRQPGPTGYQLAEIRRKGQSLAVPALAEVEVGVTDLLG